MRRIVMAMTVACLAAFGADEAAAQVSFGAQASYADDFDLGLGARVYAPLPYAGLRVVGSFDYFFPGVEGVDYLEVNANALYSFPLAGTPGVVPYVGGGLGFARVSVDLGALGDASETDLGVNAVGGVDFAIGSLTPFAELRLELGGGEQIVLTGGIRF